MKSHPYSAVPDSESLTKFRYATSDTIDSHNSISAGISALFFAGSPAAILRFIICIIINSFDGRTGRSLSHVPQKNSEIKPRRTDFYSSPAVILKLWIGRITATLNHVGPRQKGAGSIFANRMPMPQASRNSDFFLQTSAGTRVAGAKRAVIDDRLGSAIALNDASREFLATSGIAWRRIGNYEKSCEAFSDQRDCFWHERLSFNFQRLCKWWALDGNRRSLRQWSQINSVCQEIV